MGMAATKQAVLDTGVGDHHASHSTAMAAVPHIILLGYGVTDTLQLTVESQRILARFGSAYAIGLPPNLEAFLKSQRVRVTDLGHKLAPGREFADAYLDIAHTLVTKAATERPVILLAPGNPLMFNAISRYLAMEGRRLGLTVQAAPAVSPLDVIISGLGLDASTFGLQVFDATRLVARRIALNSAVPALLLSADTFAATTLPGASERPGLAPLAAYLGRCYPAGHPVSVITLDSGGMRLRGTAIEGLAADSEPLPAGSHLFLDIVRAQPSQGTPAQAVSISQGED
jgi:hypothetical protein